MSAKKGGKSEGGSKASKGSKGGSGFLAISHPYAPYIVFVTASSTAPAEQPVEQAGCNPSAGIAMHAQPTVASAVMKAAHFTTGARL